MSESKQNTADFFDGLDLDGAMLRGLADFTRHKCPQCGTSKKHFCYECAVLVGLTPGVDCPSISLPIKVDIIKHPNERNSKSTAVHAKLVAPEEVTIHTYPNVPDFDAAELNHTVLLYPCPEAIDISDLSKDSIKRVVFVDSTWSQCGGIIADPKLQKLRRVRITSEKTKFWRPQRKKPDTFLATIEAIYFFFKHYATSFECDEYDGRYDSLLFWFNHMYSLIRDTYQKKADEDRERRTKKLKLAPDAPQLS